MSIILNFEDGESYTKQQFDTVADMYAAQLIQAGYDRTCRIGIHSSWRNIFKIFGAMKVCSPVIVDEHSTTFENSTYDIDIWEDELPTPRYNQCNTTEVHGICSSGSTDQPRVVAITDQLYNVDGLDNNIQIHAKLNDTDSTVNVIPFWVGIGFQTFCVCYKHGATYHVLKDPWKEWPKVLPTFVIGSPNVLLGMMNPSIPYNNMTIRHIRTVGAPMYKDVKINAQQFFNCLPTDSYGLTELGTISIMHYPQKYNSVGFVLDNMNVTIADDNEIIANSFPTGDLGHIDDDGFLFITGRKKEIIIKGGWKIMPYEVEKALLESGATDAVVFGYDTVYAEVVGNVDKELLKSKLAHYKIPQKIFYVDSITRKGQGKINRKELLNEYIKNRKS